MVGGKRIIVVLKPRKLGESDGTLKRVKDLFEKNNYEVFVEDTEEENMVLFTPFGKFKGKTIETFLNHFSTLGIPDNIK